MTVDAGPLDSTHAPLSIVTVRDPQFVIRTPSILAVSEHTGWAHVVCVSARIDGHLSSRGGASR